MINSFVDYVSSYESSVFCEAIQASKGSETTLSQVLGESVLSILSTMGCREMPTPGNIEQLILQVARYELVSKPLGALLSLYRGVPTEYNPSLVAFQLVIYMICTKLLMPPQGPL